MQDAAESTPLYERTRQSVVALIAAGDYGPGARLPSESTLAEQFGVHRLTARRALEELVREGVVVARKGSGTFVAPLRQSFPISVPLTGHEFNSNLRRQLAAEGLTFHEQLLDVVADDGGSQIPRELREQGSLTLVRSALSVDGDAWIYSTSWFTRSRLKHVRRAWRMSDGLSGAVLDQVGVVSAQWRSFQAEPATSGVAEVLDVRLGAPVLVHGGLTLDSDGVAILFDRHFSRADRLSYIVDYPPDRR